MAETVPLPVKASVESEAWGPVVRDKFATLEISPVISIEYALIVADWNISGQYIHW